MKAKIKATLVLLTAIAIGALTVYSPILILGSITLIVTGMLWNLLYKHYKEAEDVEEGYKIIDKITGEPKKNKLV